jgi:guanosine-3',5'-bis(diphosphate) 3'-pyrophosphohydrolase
MSRGACFVNSLDLRTHFAELPLPLADYPALLGALNFAAHKHRDQRRKGTHKAPYINHPIEVATLLATSGGITDVAVLQAAILHDTIEDTGTTAAELEREFGADVTALVLEMTDNMSMPSAERKRQQAVRAPELSSRAKCIKLADKIANVGDIASQPPPDWSLERRRTYFAWTADVIAGCRGVNEGLERRYDEVLKEAQRTTR